MDKHKKEILHLDFEIYKLNQLNKLLKKLQSRKQLLGFINHKK